MVIWHRGVTAVRDALSARAVPVPEFLADIQAKGIPRVPGTAVFLTRTTSDTPPMMLWHVRTNRALHTYLVGLHVEVKDIPWVPEADRVRIEQVGENFWRITGHYGFMEEFRIEELIHAGHAKGCQINLDDVIYYIGHETVLHRKDRRGIPLWIEMIFGFMLRNSGQAGEAFSFPRDRVVEIGHQVEI
jgi:KUP system potassium uptake protein